jgi:hypothetical protein
VVVAVQKKFGFASNQESLTAQLKNAIPTFHQLHADLYCIIHSHGLEMSKTIKTLNKLVAEYEKETLERQEDKDDKFEFYYFEDIKRWNAEQIPGDNKRIEIFRNQIQRMRPCLFLFIFSIWEDIEVIYKYFP